MEKDRTYYEFGKKYPDKEAGYKILLCLANKPPAPGFILIGTVTKNGIAEAWKEVYTRHGLPAPADTQDQPDPRQASFAV